MYNEDYENYYDDDEYLNEDVNLLRAQLLIEAADLLDEKALSTNKRIAEKMGVPLSEYDKGKKYAKDYDVRKLMSSNLSKSVKKDLKSAHVRDKYEDNDSSYNRPTPVSVARRIKDIYPTENDYERSEYREKLEKIANDERLSPKIREQAKRIGSYTGYHPTDEGRSDDGKFYKPMTDFKTGLRKIQYDKNNGTIVFPMERDKDKRKLERNKLLDKLRRKK